MLKILKGDLFDHVKAGDIIAHGCNAQGVMGSGFALEIKNRYPEAFKKYVERIDFSHRYPATLRKLMGDVAWAAVGEPSNPMQVANCITQYTYGRDKTFRYVDYEAVEQSLKSVAGNAHGRRVHLPLIGGGLANGDREYLTLMFQYIFFNTDATLWLKD